MVLVLVMTVGIAVVTLIISRLNVQKIKRLNQDPSPKEDIGCYDKACEEGLKRHKTKQDIYEDLKW